MPASVLLLQQAGTAAVALARIEAASSSSSQLRRGGMRSRNSWQVLRSDDDGFSLPLAKAKGALSSTLEVRNGVQKREVSMQASRKPKQQNVGRVRIPNNKAVNMEAEGTAVTDQSIDQITGGEEDGKQMNEALDFLDSN